MAMKVFPEKFPDHKKRWPLAGPILLVILIVASFITMVRDPAEKVGTARQGQVEAQLPSE